MIAMHAQTILSQWLDGQRVFWQAAANTPAFENANTFAKPDWQAFDGFWSGMFQEDGADDPKLIHALGRYRDVILGVWQRVQSSFETHRRAVSDPASPPDWRVLRDRWFDLAEAEFISAQRGRDFLTAQGDVLRALPGWWAQVPEPVRKGLRETRRTGQAAAQTMLKLGIDGVAIAATPKEVVWRKGKTSLSRYFPLAQRNPTLPPLLICHGLIGRQTMTDLRPDRSLVRNLLAAGVDVFTLDWGDAERQESTLGVDHYFGDHLPSAIRAALETSSAENLILFGICQGGTMAACHAAIEAEGLAGLVLAVAPFDFHADVHDADPAHGLLNLWVRSLEADDIDALIGMEGMLPGPLLGGVFNQLNPVRTLRRYAVEMLETSPDPAAATRFIAMEKWLADRPDLPGAVARSWLVDLYRENALMAGNFQLSGSRIDLRGISVPVLNVFATGDHIIPPPCSRALGHKLSGPYRELALPTGHIGTFVSSRSQSLLAPAILDWMQNPD